MAEFEKWYNKQYPLPSTIERGPIGRDAKEQARSAWKAAISAENKALTTAEGEVKQLRALKCPPISDGDTCICPIEELEGEAERLKKFARHIIRQECWGNYDALDGGDIQDKAEELGLIVKHIITEDDLDIEGSYDEVGDTIYRFSETLKEKVCDEENCCAECEHGDIPCEGLAFQPKRTKKGTQALQVRDEI